MAFISSLQSKRPDYWRLFKWVALIFLLPLIFLALAPVVIIMVARLPPQGQAVFAYIGGVLAAAPVLVLRARKITLIYDEQFNHASSVTLLIFMLLTVAPIPIFLLFAHFKLGIAEVLLAFFGGAICFIGFHEVGWRLGHAVTKWWQGHHGQQQRHKEMR
jgi:hypothetical protein